MEHTASIWHLSNNGVSISCAGVAITRVWAAYIRACAAIIRVRATYTPRMLGAIGVYTTHLQRSYSVIYARRSHCDFFMVHVAHVAYAWHTSATPQRKWRSLGVCGVSTAYLIFFFVRRASAVASPANGTGAYYEKMNRYAAKSPRWFDGTSPVLLFRMCCVSTAYRWRMGDAHAAHMAHEWRCHCVWCRVLELDHCVFTAQVAYAQHTSHIRAAINAIL